MVPLLLLEYEWRISYTQPRMPPALLRQDHLVHRHLPVYSQIRVVPRYGALRLRGIEVVALVLEHHLVAEHAEPVREAPRDEELPVVVPSQLYGHVPSEGGRSLPYVHCHVENSSPYHPDKLCLRVRRPLEVQSSYDSVARPALVVLHEPRLSRHFLCKLPLGERLEEIPSVVHEYPQLDDDRAVNPCLDYFHRLNLVFLVRIPQLLCRQPLGARFIRFRCRPMAYPVSVRPSFNGCLACSNRQAVSMTGIRTRAPSKTGVFLCSEIYVCSNAHHRLKIEHCF